MTEQSSGGDVQRFFGYILLAIGVIWLAASGLCAAAMIVSMVQESASAEAIPYLLMVLVVSGISGAMGLGVLIVGRGLARRK